MRGATLEIGNSNLRFLVGREAKPAPAHWVVSDIRQFEQLASDDFDRLISRITMARKRSSSLNHSPNHSHRGEHGAHSGHLAMPELGPGARAGGRRSHSRSLPARRRITHLARGADSDFAGDAARREAGQRGLRDGEFARAGRRSQRGECRRRRSRRATAARHFWRSRNQHARDADRPGTPHHRQDPPARFGAERQSRNPTTPSRR